MWGDAYQPLMTKLVQEALIKLCSENLPAQGSYMDIDAIVCISSGKGAGNQIVVKIHKVLEPLKNSWHDTCDRSRSPWQIPLEKVRAAASSQARIEANAEHLDEGPVDLTGSRDHSRSILQYTSENFPHHLVNSSNNHGANNNNEPLRLTNGSHDSSLESINQSGAIYKGPIPVPRVDENMPSLKSEVLNRLTKLQPPNYKPLPHLKLKSPVKQEVGGDQNINSSSMTRAIHGSDKSSTKEMQCKICSHVCYGGFPALQSHTQEMHRRYVCRFCYNTFSLRCNLKRHERLHVGLKPYNCKVCNKSFARSTDLKLHMHKHGMSGNDVVVPCPKCPRSFLSVQNLRWHLYKVHKETEATFACTICEKLFLDKEEYMKHRDEHTNLSGSRPPSSAATIDSQDTSDFIEFGPDDSIDGDSDNDNLCIDTQSEGTMDSAYPEEFDTGLPIANRERPGSNNSNDLGFELVNEPVNINFDNNSNSARSSEDRLENMDPTHTSTPNIGPDGGNTTTGSRKRKKGHPTKHVEIPQAVVEDELDIDNMYYNSPAAKQRQVDKEREVIAESYENMNNEPQDLVMRIKPPKMMDHNSLTSTPTSMTTPQNTASSTMRHIAEAVMSNFAQQPQMMNRNYVHNAIPAQGYIQPVNSLGNSWDSSNFKNLKVALTGQSPVSFPGHKTPEPPKVTESYSPLTLPILITPDSNKYKPSPKNVIKSTPGENPDLNTSAADDPNKEFQCVEFGCNETYLGFSAYEDHCMLRHGRYPCKYCKQTFSGKNNRTRHMRCHVGAKVYTCPDCFKNFSRPDSMREHQFIHTLSYQEDKCRNCGSAFDKKNLLLAHLKQCYRHKMETGKSTKLIDETPAYLNNSVDNNISSTEGELDFKPLKPIKLESFPMLGNMDGSRGTPPLSAIVNAATLAAKAGSPAFRGSPTMMYAAANKGFTNVATTVSGSPMSPIIIMPTDVAHTPQPRMSPLTISASLASPIASSVSRHSALSVPVVLTANAVQAAVKAVSASSNAFVPVPALIAPLPTTDVSSTTSPLALTDKTQQQLNASSSANIESPVNSVLDAVKNLVKSRASPAIMDQNANKTPGVESTE